ncbi:uncharacterized protein TRIADDRAFT_20131 [Trichoplax adhaerens]|uniref:Short-chain specific acyl-CoA dehydrogenase, mitochondrial n=1 Tax=Trichoplax adhaerens TaxID=10228 RepID=B3RK78_TRIAD|nr:hypothetical protein TRIADDRAFT_20131 [Trichoplax adhaerens]EDV29877.1 hypothetical protein TRIADDRAFT_20131 [Trichoplax adhaerens]|eukprot:XP_002109079.1 hypothetical protein TRIADDRAFT_20131 [Trichoplax adhaerens]
MFVTRQIFKRTGLYLSRYSKLSSSCYYYNNYQQAFHSNLPLVELSEEEQMIKDNAARFSKEKIAPRVREMEETKMFPKDLLEEVGKLGWFGFRIPPEYGGSGGSLFQLLLIAEEVCKVDPGFSSCFGYQNTLTSKIILGYASEEQKQEYLPRIAKGMFTSVCLSEPDSGSDAFSLQTRAVPDGDDYVINGRKLWITNAEKADLYLIMANAAPEQGYKGITCFIVDAGTPGLSVPRNEQKMGLNIVSNCPVMLDDVRVPASNIIGNVGGGYKIMANALTDGRIGIAAQVIGGAQGVLDIAIPYVMERKQFGKRLFDFQAMQHQIAQATVEVTAARLLYYNAAKLLDQKLPSVKEASMAKYFATEVACQVCIQGIKWLGALGYMKEMPVEKFLRDLVAATIYEGTSNIQLNTIAACLKAEYR